MKFLTIDGLKDFGTQIKNWAESSFALAAHSHNAATSGSAGFMSAADKSKLDGIEDGATAGGSGDGTEAATVMPSMDGTAAVGSSERYAREDHVHPTDTTRASKREPIFEGGAYINGSLASTDNSNAIPTTYWVNQNFVRRSNLTKQLAGQIRFIPKIYTQVSLSDLLEGYNYPDFLTDPNDYTSTVAIRKYDAVRMWDRDEGRNIDLDSYSWYLFENSSWVKLEFPSSSPSLSSSSGNSSITNLVYNNRETVIPTNDSITLSFRFNFAPSVWRIFTDHALSFVEFNESTGDFVSYSAIPESNYEIDYGMQWEEEYPIMMVIINNLTSESIKFNQFNLLMLYSEDFDSIPGFLISNESEGE